MTREDEKRFLVLMIDQKELDKHPAQHIEQGYFDDRRPSAETRVRIKNRIQGSINEKIGAGEVRDEGTSYEIPLGAAKLLLKVTPDALSKYRRVVNGWEIDVYEPPLTGLIIAEYERKTPNEEIPPLPSCIVRSLEVTNLLSNITIAKLATRLKQARTELADPLKDLLTFANELREG